GAFVVRYRWNSCMHARAKRGTSSVSYGRIVGQNRHRYGSNLSGNLMDAPFDIRGSWDGPPQNCHRIEQTILTDGSEPRAFSTVRGYVCWKRQLPPAVMQDRLQSTSSRSHKPYSSRNISVFGKPHAFSTSGNLR